MKSLPAASSPWPDGPSRDCARSAVAERSREKGFTLIEMMIVVILIGIMTAMIIPEMKGTFQDALLRSTGRRLVETLNLANSHAVSLNQAHQVVFDRRAHRYTIERTLRTSQQNSEPAPLADIPGGQGEI